MQKSEFKNYIEKRLKGYSNKPKSNIQSSTVVKNNTFSQLINGCQKFAETFKTECAQMFKHLPPLQDVINEINSDILYPLDNTLATDINNIVDKITHNYFVERKRIISKTHDVDELNTRLDLLKTKYKLISHNILKNKNIDFNIPEHIQRFFTEAEGGQPSIEQINLLYEEELRRLENE